MFSSKNLSLVEQKKLQWAREREEMMGLYGLWGKPRGEFVEKNGADESKNFYGRNQLLPPIVSKNKEESTKEFRPEDESETSGYLSDSPKRLKQVQETPEEYRHSYHRETDHISNEDNSEEVSKSYWSESDKTDNYWAERKIYKNYKNENWTQPQQQQQRLTNEYLTEEYSNPRVFQVNKNDWNGTPESLYSDDGNRLRWGDRGVGIGHLWDPVINPPDCRLPQVNDYYRQTPKWVEKGLKNHDGSKSELLIISHPDDECFEYKGQRNFILGQNVPIPPEVIEERERKRKKALEHQNAIKKQLEERAVKRKQEKERRIEEERLEEERIKKEQEIERIRYEEEQKKMKEKEEMERKREEAMKQAIEIAEKRAREEKKKTKNKRRVLEDESRHAVANKPKFSNLEKTIQPTETGLAQRNQAKKYRKQEDNETNSQQTARESPKKTLKDSSSQFEDIQLANSFQLLNVNGLPVDGGLALMLDNPSNDNSFLLPPDGVQLALLMSPRNATTTNRLLPVSPSVSESTYSVERTLTPSKFRPNQRHRHHAPSNKATQTDFRHSCGWTTPGSAGKRRRLSLRCGSKTGCNAISQKTCNMSEKTHKQGRCYPNSKYRSKPHASKLEDRPKWGINRPSVQYKKQSEKDPYYQKRLREKLKGHAADAATSSDQTLKNEEDDETTEEKELDSVVRILDLREGNRQKSHVNEPEMVLQNGFRMNSNLSSPVFVPIDNRMKSAGSKGNRREIDSEEFLHVKEDKEGATSETEDEKNSYSDSSRFLTPIQLEAIEKISSLREHKNGLGENARHQEENPRDEANVNMIKLDDFLSKKKEPAQVLDLSRVKITSKEDFKRYLDKIPECKVKPEKVSAEQVKSKEKDFTFVPGKKEEKYLREWNYPDPTPPDMKGVKLEDLCPINIDWKMLTTIRPKSKVEEDMFSRLVQLGKLDLKHQQMLQREKATDWIRRTKNPKSSIIEMRVISCKECGEDFCDGSLCSKLIYENFFRPQPTTSNLTQNLSLLASESEGKNLKKKRRRRKIRRQKNKKEKTGGEGSKRRRRNLGKTSIFNRPANAGCTRDHFRTKGVQSGEKLHSRALSSTRSFSCERRRINLIPKRSKSAPRIHFECETSDSEVKRYYLSDSGPSNTDYSSQESDSEGSEREFLGPRLRLSGRRKLLSARVSFLDRKRRGEPEQGEPIKFVRQCTLYREDATTSESSSPARSRSLSKSPEKNLTRFSPSSMKVPSTVRIEFDEECPGITSGINVAWPVSTLRKNLFLRRQNQVEKLTNSISKLELDSGTDGRTGRKGEKKVRSKRSKGKKEDVDAGSIATECCLKTKGIFERREVA